MTSAVTLSPTTIGSNSTVTGTDIVTLPTVVDIVVVPIAAPFNLSEPTYAILLSSDVHSHSVTASTSLFHSSPGSHTLRFNVTDGSSQDLFTLTVRESTEAYPSALSINSSDRVVEAVSIDSFGSVYVISLSLLAKICVQKSIPL